jgi:hypothetical protein
MHTCRSALAFDIIQIYFFSKKQIFSNAKDDMEQFFDPELGRVVLSNGLVIWMIGEGIIRKDDDDEPQ